MATLEFKVPEDMDGERLDRAAAKLATGLSRARLKKAIDERAVRVNGRVKKKGDLVAAGDTISIAEEKVSNPDAPAVATPDAPLDVRFEGDGVVVVDKPAGEPTAPLRPNETGTLANALVARYPECAGVGYGAREPGLVHRLDTDTSGLVVCARTAEAFETLRDALRDGRLEKRYLLVCDEADLADTGTIDIPIANHPKDQRRVYPCIHPRDVMRYSPRPASTKYEVLKRAHGLALVEVEVSRALRHQIRAHFSAIGHPLVGDALYGGKLVEGLGRHALHASRVTFAGAPKVAKFDVSSHLPPALQALVD
ncbi:MAG TPA: RluA family pseudouridine synthase [Polyangiaceae bacterium]